MKNLVLCLFFVSLFASCTIATEKNDIFNLLEDEVSPVQRIYNDTIANESNPYDYCGQLFSEMLYSYYERPRSVVDLDTVISVIEQIAHRNTAFRTIEPVYYTAPVAGRVAYLLANKETCQTAVFQDAGLSSHASLCLDTFITDYRSLCSLEDKYSVIYNFVKDYERAVLADLSLADFEKKVILVSSSIARYSAAAKKKRPKKNTDPAWDFLICGIYGSIDRVSSSSAEAITMALVVAIGENQ